MRAWRPDGDERLFSHRIFNLERRRLAAGDHRREALVLAAPDWVNVIPLLEGDRVLLVRQWRFGISAPTLEIPGGMLEEGDDASQAAARELEEETGYRAHGWRRLGALRPNPAIQDNRLTTYLATDLERLGEPRADGDEEIELETAPLASIPDLIAGGEIDHALVVAAFYLLIGSSQRLSQRAGTEP